MRVPPPLLRCGQAPGKGGRAYLWLQLTMPPPSRLHHDLPAGRLRQRALTCCRMPRLILKDWPGSLPLSCLSARILCSPLSGVPKTPNDGETRPYVDDVHQVRPAWQQNARQVAAGQGIGWKTGCTGLMHERDSQCQQPAVFLLPPACCCSSRGKMLLLCHSLPRMQSRRSFHPCPPPSPLPAARIRGRRGPQQGG